MTSTVQPSSSTGLRADVAFQHTLWSRVFAARRLEDSSSANEALETLCRLYWYPLYAYLRRAGHERQSARDLTQGFFAYVLMENLLRKADPEKGRFRSFLLGCLRKFVSNQQRYERATKRGGGIAPLSIDEIVAEHRYTLEPAVNLTPEKLFDRRWSLEVIAEALRRLQREYQRAGMTDLFAALQPYLVGEQSGHLADLAAQLDVSEGAARVTLCRLRNRLRKLIRNVIADTVSHPDQVESELQHLQAALRDL